MSSEPLWALQQAVFQHLSANSTLTDLLANGANSIYDHVPANPTFPHTVMGEADQSTLDTTSNTLYNIRMAISCFSTSDGMREIKQIADAITHALHHQTITCTGYTVIQCKHMDSKITRAGDGKTRQCIQTFQFFIEQN